MINDREARLRTRLKEDLEFYDKDSVDLDNIKYIPSREKKARVDKDIRVRRPSKFDTVFYS